MLIKLGKTIVERKGRSKGMCCQRKCSMWNELKKSPEKFRAFSVSGICLLCKHLNELCKHAVCERVRFQTFEQVELVEHQTSVAERNNLKIDARLEFAICDCHGTCENLCVRKFGKRNARNHGRCKIV